MLSKFDSVDSIVNYLREPTVVDPTLTASRIIKAKKQQQQEKQKEKEVIPTPVDADIQILAKGRVRYGPVTVNPRKQPSKTLFTGRRSKYEVLAADEEEKRRDRRERNRVAATKCREKRENVLSNLETQHANELNTNKQLTKLINDLEQRKLDLETVMNNHLNECLLMNNSSSAMIFGDTGFLSSIIDAPPPPLPTYSQTCVNSEEEELSLFLDSDTPLLTNSAYRTDESNPAPIPLPMTNSSIDRLMNALQSPTISMESINNHSMLFNSAVGSSCAKQHSNSSEDDSLPPKCNNPYVC